MISKVVQSYKKDDVEILILETKNQLYNAIFLIGNNESQYCSELDLESALDTFEYWLDGLKEKK